MPKRFNPPANWPAPPAGWTPPPGWRPDPAWGPAPAGHQLWVDDRGWFRRHKVATAVAAVLLVGGVGSAFGGGGADTAVPVAVAHTPETTPAASESDTPEPTPSTPTPTPSPTTPTPSPSPSATSARPTQAARSGIGDVLLAGGAVVLPNRSRTPGSVNPAVTQSTIHKTICLTGYTRTIRPSSSYTTSLKEQQLASGYAYHGDLATSDYEEDHLISLELGGAASDARNLWPEPYAATDGARVKDRVENRLHDLVCSGALSLATAQRAIASNWWTAFQRYGGEGMPQVWDGSYGTSSSGSTTTSSGSTSTSSGSSAPTGATALCRDGSYSFSQHRSGTCSYHGGVARWINPPPS